jgi:hypothetical protein
MLDAMEHIKRDLQRKVEKAQESNDQCAADVAKRGAASVALWFDGYLKADHMGREAQRALNFLTATPPVPVGEVAAIFRKEANAELGYISLGNKQTVMSSDVAKAQAKLELAIELDANAKWLAKEEA